MYGAKGPGAALSYDENGPGRLRDDFILYRARIAPQIRRYLGLTLLSKKFE
jgi:hypothetical protein